MVIKLKQMHKIKVVMSSTHITKRSTQARGTQAKPNCLYVFVCHFSNGQLIANIFITKPLKPSSRNRGLKTLDSATDCFCYVSGKV